MQKTQKNLYLLYMIFAMALVTANCIASKVFNTGLTLFGAPVTLTVGAICYPFTFLMTDVIGELWGKKEASYAVGFGFIVQLFSTAIIIIANALPAVDEGVQQAYQTLLGQNWVFVVASLTAYVCSQKWDVFAFHSIREWWLSTHNGSTKGGKWLWNNVGTMTSQVIDSVIYVAVAFGFGFGWFFQSEMHTVLLNMVIGQIVIKWILALCDTPIFYFLTRKPKEAKKIATF